MGSSPISPTIDTLRAAHCMMCLLFNLIRVSSEIMYGGY